MQFLVLGGVLWALSLNKKKRGEVRGVSLARKDPRNWGATREMTPIALYAAKQLTK